MDSGVAARPYPARWDHLVTWRGASVYQDRDHIKVFDLANLN
jgi:hypothetical protein